MHTFIICLFQEKSRNSLKDMYKHNRYIYKTICWGSFYRSVARYPTPDEKRTLAKKTGLTLTQVLYSYYYQWMRGHLGNLASCDPYVFAYIVPASWYFLFLLSLLSILSLFSTCLSCISLHNSPVILVLSLVNPAKIVTRKSSQRCFSKNDDMLVL